ncbi:MAG: chromosome partitioning protein ParB [Flavobacteriaceae bacterium]|nr:chromosome partitioning protein ParB [Flavobacteriaceae bacterium]
MLKMPKKKALGRGLSELLKDNNQTNESKEKKPIERNIDSLEIEFIKTNPFQPRTNFNKEKIDELALSISKYGIIQPITVKKLKNGYYELISGERRLRASKLLGLKKIPAYVKSNRKKESLEMALVENIQREDLDPIEVATSYEKLINEIGLTQTEISERVGKKRSTITNYIRLLKLDTIIQIGIRDKFISMGHGRALINIDDFKLQIEIYKKIVSKKLSVRETEDLIRKKKGINKKIRSKNQTAYTKTIRNKLEKILETPIKIKINNQGKGSINIPFNSQVDLEKIINKINEKK